MCRAFLLSSNVKTVLKLISKRHGIDGNLDTGVLGDNAFKNPALLGWSQGALVAQMVAQKTNNLISKLVLYGSIYDPLICYPREPLYTTTWTPMRELFIVM